MGELVYLGAVISGVVILLSLVWRAVNWVWWKPKKLEKYLREQGINGHPYRLLSGDLKENTMLTKEAQSKPMNLSHDIVPRVVPPLHQTIKNYGKKSVIWTGPTPRVIIMDPELIGDVLSNKFGHFLKSQGNPMERLLVTGVINHEGEKWAKHRRVINPAFHQEKLKRILPAVYKSCGEMVSKWEKLVLGAGSCELDVWPELQNLTGDVISRTSFGSSYEEGRRINQLLNEQAMLLLQGLQSVYIPGLSFLPTKRNKRMKELNREVRALIRGIINKREKSMKANEASNDDLLGLLIESNSKDIQEHGNNKKAGLSIEDVIDECKLFYFAGQETTSTLLVWTMIVLSMHPNWQVRAREEVLQVFGKNKPDFDGLSQLKIVTMILYEVLRLYPPAISLLRVTSKKIQLGEISLPPGVELALPAILVHHDRELWGEDAQEFKPERFSKGVSKATKNQVSFFPFGWGARICIGQNFAMIEAKMILAMILQHFSFELSPSYAHAPYTILTLQPQYGAHMILHKMSPPHIPKVYIPEDPVLQIASALRIEINQCFAVLRDMASGRDLKKFLTVIAGLWILSIVGSCCNFLTFFYILHAVPVFYEKYEDQVDSFAEKAMAEIKKQYAVFDAKVLSKIPRGLLKDKKKAS
ncbi:hypothetical protein HHK36_004960 [Tetracentron sinense]|uniref:Reticulon domain-containing protein n=1 Tax=Tetracentron sinense TaxID=13715 RepID=A0A834ZT48_TETSI|nr:hypothetical protein HHK36_004960 [Tetracentron sinense]